MKRIALSIIISLLLFSCSSQKEFLFSSATATPTVVPAILKTQLAMSIVTPTVDSIPRASNDFLPPPSPMPSMTPTKVFLPVSDKEQYDGLVVTLERTMCFGTCPAYSLIIYGTGEGIYEGKFNVKVEGVQEFNLSQEQLKELVEAFEVAYYFSFRDYYAVGITDAETTKTSITFQGHSKTVSHYGWCLDYENIVIPDGMPKDAAPKILCDLENKIDEIVNVAQWTDE